MSGLQHSEALYTHREKGGQYRLLSSDAALPAGSLRESLGQGTPLIVYQDINTGSLYVRLSDDFNTSMQRVINDVVY